MMLTVNNIAIFLMYYGVYVFGTDTSAAKYEKKSYFAVEHPVVQYLNKKHFSFANMTSRRYSRKDPVYYFNLHFRNVYPLGNNYTYSFYFYEFLTNVYKPSFVEIHAKGCNLLRKDPVFGAPILRALRKIQPNVDGCPIPVGDWNMQNCTINAAVLPNFPFQKGRIYANATFNPTGELTASGYVDFQIKEMKVKVQT